MVRQNYAKSSKKCSKKLVSGQSTICFKCGRLALNSDEHLKTCGGSNNLNESQLNCSLPSSPTSSQENSFHTLKGKRRSVRESRSLCEITPTKEIGSLKINSSQDIPSLETLLEDQENVNPNEMMGRSSRHINHTNSIQDEVLKNLVSTYLEHDSIFFVQPLMSIISLHSEQVTYNIFQSLMSKLISQSTPQNSSESLFNGLNQIISKLSAGVPAAKWARLTTFEDLIKVLEMLSIQSNILTKEIVLNLGKYILYFKIWLKVLHDDVKARKNEGRSLELSRIADLIKLTAQNKYTKSNFLLMLFSFQTMLNLENLFSEQSQSFDSISQASETML